MDLRKWAEREGLKYFHDSNDMNELGVVEMAYEAEHCIDCGDVYAFVFRATHDGVLRRYMRIGGDDSVVVTTESELEGLTRSSFEPPKHAVMSEESLIQLAGGLIKHIKHYRNNPIEKARLAAGDIVQTLLMAAASLGRQIGIPDDGIEDMLSDVLEDYGQPDPHTMQMERVQ